MDIKIGKKISPRIIIFTAFILAFSMLSVAVIAGWTRALDEYIYLVLSDQVQGIVLDFFACFTYLGSVYVVLPLMIGVMYFFYISKKSDLTLNYGIMMASALLSFLVVKYLIGRPRPGAGMEHPSISIVYGYPSGHTTGMFTLLLGFYVFYFLKWKGKGNGFILAFCLLIASGVGFSRLAVGVHYLTDILGGVLLSGIWVTFFYIWIGEEESDGIADG
ncbi:MAG: phosphatase PAP2 family protein [Candidatus Natronoplasma sp.]